MIVKSRQVKDSASGSTPRRQRRARTLGPTLGLGLALLVGACGQEPSLVALLLPEPEEDAYVQPAVYPDPDAPRAESRYGAGGAAYDGNDEIVNGKCMRDHPVTYCTTIEGAFKQPVATLVYHDRYRFLAGNRVFNANWVPAPMSYNEFRDGLGPFFDAESCAGCHINNGRGRPPQDAAQPPKTMVVKISLRPSAGEAEPHPRYGDQFNYQAIPGARAEGRINVSYQDVRGRFADGEPFTLRRPAVAFSDLAYGPLGEDILVSPRLAPPVIGLGLVEAMEEDAILALADPDDADGDGISGRPNYVPDPVDGDVKLGRFGWKAGATSLSQQTANALHGDMGITSPAYLASNCTDSQKACDSLMAGGEPEIRDRDFGDLLYYMQLLGPSARRGVDDPEVARGEELFESAGCAACHVPRLVSAVHPDYHPQLSHMIFHPYSDFLLHDMGEGLADNRPEHQADGREWRTPPLWGLGRTEQVGRQVAFFLHDGRARSLMEAVLWHGGEAARARNRVLDMAKADRAALVAFLKSL